MVNTVRRIVISITIVAVILIVGWFAYTEFLAPDPSTLLTTRATSSARNAMIEQDWEDALSVLTDAKASAKESNWELLTWYAVLSEKNGISSGGSLAQALTLTDPETVWITYGMVSILAEESTLVLKAGQELISDNANSVQGYFLLAQAYDLQEDLATALEYYELSLDTIDKVGGHEGIYITVRQRVAQLNIELMQEEILCC